MEGKIFHYEEVRHITSNEGVQKRKVNKRTCESMYNGLHDSVREDFDAFWAAVKGFHNMTEGSLQQFLFKYRHGSDEELIAGIWELEKNEDLPSDWQMYGDELGNVWYENAETQESVWERPRVKEDIHYPEDDEEDEPDAFTLEVEKLVGMGVGPEGGGKMRLSDFTMSTTEAAEKERHRRELEMAPKLEHALDGEGRLARKDSNARHTKLGEIGRKNSVHGKADWAQLTKGLGGEGKWEEGKKVETLSAKLASARKLQKDQEVEEAKKEKEEGAKDVSGVGSVLGDKVASKITIEMFDMDTFGKGDFLGQCNIPFEKLATPPGEAEIIELELQRAEPGSVNDSLCVETVKGVLGVHLSALDLNDETDKVEKWTLRIMYAKGVAKADLFGKSDPICFVKWGKEDIGKVRSAANSPRLREASS